ncbi:uncharacterized protein TRIVIDRAFT_210335 [Trichoderma virens Gv29-8]|uniref:Transcription factor domain-containing protein n=1 Tax=Hypocrea virens (strain Gv29-8 / FGSC 10586) TaxID=413071 RepID=G9N6R6_HYPVG|nr:uncharacterized protein TRIVIDRAFT_210335 [Trichoderma virens Gv29-8]EHK17417.1 hypothetical protein TRIVIDRAFT_210335 [Trichoderma virens Gv29-8]UKZ53863.1 hypothetical protein TrVGV298_007665 [Trichoderma virens]UKZ79659.1 hypothetical protein TrVFT333_007419 [Trichoderma virens FT-333]
MTTWDVETFYEMAEAQSKIMDMGSRLLILDNLGHLTDCILRLAFYDATPASNAILYSLLALSSLNLGRTGPAVVLKIKALSYLQQSLRLGNIGHRTAQHLMASMLLYLCETFQISSTTKDWAEYLCGAKQIVVSGVLAQEVHADISLLFDWVSYHEIFARFGLVYWKPAVAMRGMRFCAMDPVAAKMLVPRHDFGCDRQVLDYTSSIFTALMPRITEDKDLTHSQTQDLYVVEAKLRSGLLESPPIDVTSTEISRDRDKTTELYRIAALIYLNRAALGYSGEELRHRNLVHRGLDLLCGKLTYVPPWPVFMISCEARDDAQRMTALQILAKAGEEPRSFNMRLLRELVEACWNQDDLHDEEAMDYHTKLRLAIQSAPYVPPFS